uniref:Uncharacterized protein n=1 Tax=Equus caballus TaxID=9796 RepID=A0A9L0T5X5_HORSE
LSVAAPWLPRRRPPAAAARAPRRPGGVPATTAWNPARRTARAPRGCSPGGSGAHPGPQAGRFSAPVAALLALATVLGHELVVAAFAVDRSLRSRGNFNLAVADLLVGGFCIPLYVLIREWKFGKELCKLWLVTDVFHIVLISYNRPEEMCTGAHSSALIRFLQKFGCSKSTLSPQRLMILFTEALHPFKSTNDQGDGSQLCFGITDFIFIQRKRLVDTKHKGPLGTNHLLKCFPKYFPPNPYPVRHSAVPSDQNILCLLLHRHKRQLIKMLTGCNKETCFKFCLTPGSH